MSRTVVFYEPNNASSGLGSKTEIEKGIRRKVDDVLYNAIQITYIYIFICIRLYIVYVYIYADVHVAFIRDVVFRIDENKLL